MPPVIDPKKYKPGPAGPGRHLIPDPRTAGTSPVERSALLAYFRTQLSLNQPIYYYPGYRPLPTGYFVRFNRDGSEDVVYRDNNRDVVIQSIIPPLEGEFVYVLEGLDGGMPDNLIY